MRNTRRIIAQQQLCGACANLRGTLRMLFHLPVGAIPLLYRVEFFEQRMRIVAECNQCRGRIEQGSQAHMVFVGKDDGTIVLPIVAFDAQIGRIGIDQRPFPFIGAQHLSKIPAVYENMLPSLLHQREQVERCMVGADLTACTGVPPTGNRFDAPVKRVSQHIEPTGSPLKRIERLAIVKALVVLVVQRTAIGQCPAALLQSGGMVTTLHPEIHEVLIDVIVDFHMMGTRFLEQHMGGAAKEINKNIIPIWSREGRKDAGGRIVLTAHPGQRRAYYVRRHIPPPASSKSSKGWTTPSAIT